MRFVVTRDAQEFDARTRDLLIERLECNIVATVLMGILEGGYSQADPVFAYGVDDREEVRFAALRTPPWPLLTTPLEGDAGGLVGPWLREDPDVTGVTGVPGTVRAIGAAWSERTGGTVATAMREAMHVLDRVEDPPRPARGDLRLATESDRALLVEWTEAFVVEAGVAGAGQAEGMVAVRLRRGGLFVWEDDRPVSMIGVSPEVAGVVRVGPVYTPPEDRRRGYGGSAVAATSRRALAQGAQRCMLFTDLANPTSNKIYAEVGYRREADWEELSFLR
jgi:RimJ/RimL family protein N-acetyltransferase